MSISDGKEFSIDFELLFVLDEFESLAATAAAAAAAATIAAEEGRLFINADVTDADGDMFSLRGSQVPPAELKSIGQNSSPPSDDDP